MARLKKTPAAGVKDITLFTLIHDFFKVYLTKLANKSPRTVEAYRESLEALLDFVIAEKGINLYEVTFEMIDRHMLARFLDHLENERGCEISTRNHRLNRIRAFYKYAAEVEPSAVIHRSEILKVPVKNFTKPEIIEYMSEDAVKTILEQPDTKTKIGVRDQFLMVMLYDTGARIEELVAIQLRDIRLGKTPTVILHGKRNKVRTVPLMATTVAYFHNYAAVFHPDADAYSDRFLFYVTSYGQDHKMHQDTARKRIAHYGTLAKQRCGEVPDDVHPHLWRHTRAMHLYQRGMDLTLISQWLGHSSIDTTRIYAKADTEQKRQAIAKASSKSGPLSEKLNPERFTVSDNDLLKKLYGLR